MTRPTALRIYRSLPKKQCGRCGEKTCIEYALKLLKGERKLEDCGYLSAEQKKNISGILSPKVRAVSIGAGPSAVKAGGEDVMYRHEYKFASPTAVFIEMSDVMDAKDSSERTAFVKGFAVERLGKKLAADGISIHCVSGEADRFAECVKTVAKKFDGPLILRSQDPQILEAGIVQAKGRRPLLHAATLQNWRKVLAIAEKYGASVAACGNDVKDIIKIAKELSSRRFRDIVLDPGVSAGAGTAETIDRFTHLRKEAVEGNPEYGYPLMGIASAKNASPDPYQEAMTAGMLVSRYASIIVMRTIEPWAILPVLTLRQSLYSDPAIEPCVEAKLYPVGSPDRDSPVLLTTNFALTYYSVLQDIEDAKISCYLLVVDTGGLAVTVAIAADKLTTGVIKEALIKDGVAQKVAHRKLIMPGVTGQLKDEIEKATGWNVLVGPQDSSQIGSFLKENRKEGI